MSTNRNKKKILVVTHDMGGTRALLPVLLGLRKDPSYAIALYAGAFGQPVLSEAGVRFVAVDTDIDPQKARAIFDEEAPDLLLSATSWNSNVEQQMRNEAFAQNIPSVVVFDYWSNPNTRWGVEWPVKGFDKMPDIICIMDKAYKEVMLKYYFSPNSLFVTGHPHLEQLWQNHRDIKLKAMPKRLLFLSQPSEVLSSLFDVNVHPLIQILRYLDLYAHQQNGCQLTIKLHPKENKANILKIVNAHPKSQLNIIIEDGATLLEQLVESHDVVMGYRSMGLFEARAMGRPTFAIEKIFLIEQSLQEAMRNFGIPILPIEDLNNLSAVLGKFERFMIENPYAGATDKILTLIKKQLCTESLAGGCTSLQLFSMSDISDTYISWLNDPIVCRDNAHADPKDPYTREKAEKYVQSVMMSDTTYMFAIRWKETGQHIGNCAISSIDWTKKTGMLTIIIGDKDSWGKGVGTEVYQLLLEFGFRQLGLEKIISGQTTRNTAMIKICEKAGMKNQGLSSNKLIKGDQSLDMVVYAISRTEYEAFIKSGKFVKVCP